jgi:hypothetical protein
MTHELFYTSAPRGLQPGAMGFCTVAATRGLPAGLWQKLESLSAYRALYALHDANAGLNPVIHAHYRIDVGGKSYSVLTRIAAAGLDYSGRNNKFAHHIVLESHERPAAGPAWLLSQPGFMESAWDGEVRLLENGRIPPRGDASPRICEQWAAATGDAGWAGVVTEWFLADPQRSVFLLHEPGVDLLPLFDEAIALLQPERRWELTFSTYAVGIPQGTTCHWRGLVKGSTEAKLARRASGALVIELGSDLGAASGGAHVTVAQTGERVPELPSRFEPALQDLASATRQRAREKTPQKEPSFYSMHLEPPRPSAPALPPAYPRGKGGKKTRRKAGRWIAVSAACVVLLAGLSYATLIGMRNDSPGPQQEHKGPSVTGELRNAEVINVPSLPADATTVKNKPPDIRGSEQNIPKSNEPDSKSHNTGSGATTARASKPNNSPTENSPTPKKKDLIAKPTRARNEVARPSNVPAAIASVCYQESLPTYSFAGKGQRSTSISLWTNPGAGQPQHSDISLNAEPFLVLGSFELLSSLEPKPSVDRLELYSKVGSDQKVDKVAEFIHSQGKLQFRWNEHTKLSQKEANGAYHRLTSSILRVARGDIEPASYFRFEPVLQMPPMSKEFPVDKLKESDPILPLLLDEQRMKPIVLDGERPSLKPSWVLPRGSRPSGEIILSNLSVDLEGCVNEKNLRPRKEAGPLLTIDYRARLAHRDSNEARNKPESNLWLRSISVSMGDGHCLSIQLSTTRDVPPPTPKNPLTVRIKQLVLYTLIDQGQARLELLRIGSHEKTPK